MICGVQTPKLTRCLSCHLPLCPEVTDLLRLGNGARDLCCTQWWWRGYQASFNTVKGRRPVISCETQLVCGHKQFQAGSRLTWFAYSTPKFVDLGRNDITHIRLHELLCKWHASLPFEILQGSLLGRFRRVLGMSLTLQVPILARWLQLQPWMLSWWYLNLCTCCWNWMSIVM